MHHGHLTRLTYLTHLTRLTHLTLCVPIVRCHVRKKPFTYRIIEAKVQSLFCVEFILESSPHQITRSLELREGEGDLKNLESIISLNPHSLRSRGELAC